MPIPWLIVLQSIPWTDVIKNAPKVADGAKKLWSSVSKKSPADELPPTSPEAATVPGSQAGALLPVRVAMLESEVADLHTQMRASSELITILAEQNTQLIAHIEANRVRVAWLTRATAALVSLAVLGIALAWARL